MSTQHLKEVIKKLEQELADVYAEAYNDGLKDGRDEIISKAGTTEKTVMNFQSVSDKKKIVSILSTLPPKINIEYIGGSNPGWKENCKVTSCSKTSTTIQNPGGGYRTFLHKKIKSVKYPENHIQKAIKNYEEFHSITTGVATELDVINSSAGIDGWASARAFDDIIEKFKHMDFYRTKVAFDGFSGQGGFGGFGEQGDKNKKRRTSK